MAEKIEELSRRLEVYSRSLDILDGVRGDPNAQEEYEVIQNIIRQTEEAMAVLKSRLEESKLLAERQRALEEKWDKLTALNFRRVDIVRVHHTLTKATRRKFSASGALDSLMDRFKHITDNAEFYSQFVAGDAHGESRLSVTPEPQDFMAHSSPFFPEPTPSTTISCNAFHSTLRVPEVSQPQPQPPKTPKPINDLDVAISYISNQDFVKIPAYMKGRLRTEDVNAFVTQFNDVLNKKLGLLQKPKRSLKLKKEMDLVAEWKAQNVASLSGQYFLSAKDFVSLADYKFSKKDFSIVTILRHVQRIKETRVGKTVFYLACF